MLCDDSPQIPGHHLGPLSSWLSGLTFRGLLVCYFSMLSAAMCTDIQNSSSMLPKIGVYTISKSTREGLRLEMNNSMLLLAHGTYQYHDALHFNVLIL